jgi:hypothetical protein
MLSSIVAGLFQMNVIIFQIASWTVWVILIYSLSFGHRKRAWLSDVAGYACLEALGIVFHICLYQDHLFFSCICIHRESCACNFIYAVFVILVRLDVNISLHGHQHRNSRAPDATKRWWSPNYSLFSGYWQLHWTDNFARVKLRTSGIYSR